MNHPADFENICFCTLQDTCGGPDTELKLDMTHSQMLGKIEYTLPAKF